MISRSLLATLHSLSSDKIPLRWMCDGQHEIYQNFNYSTAERPSRKPGLLVADVGIVRGDADISSAGAIQDVPQICLHWLSKIVVALWWTHEQ
jgi:hypothetical protein